MADRAEDHVPGIVMACKFYEEGIINALDFAASLRKAALPEELIATFMAMHDRSILKRDPSKLIPPPTTL